jgi:hypothetical protein
MGIEDSRYFAQMVAEELKQKRKIEKRRKVLFKKISSSKEEALKALKVAGIYDENGHLSEIYR